MYEFQTEKSTAIKRMDKLSECRYLSDEFAQPNEDFKYQPRPSRLGCFVYFEGDDNRNRNFIVLILSENSEMNRIVGAVCVTCTDTGVVPRLTCR